MQTHSDPGENCDYCGKTFLSNIHLDSHIKTKHTEKEVAKTKQYNCKELKKQSTSHVTTLKNVKLVTRSFQATGF